MPITQAQKKNNILSEIEFPGLTIYRAYCLLPTRKKKKKNPDVVAKGGGGYGHKVKLALHSLRIRAGRLFSVKAK